MNATTVAPSSAATSEPRETFWTSRVVRRFRRNKLALIGLFLVVTFIFTAIFAPLMATPKGNCLRDLDTTSSTSVYNPFGAVFWASRRDGCTTDDSRRKPTEPVSTWT